MCGIGGYQCFDKYDDRLSVAIPIIALLMEQRGRVSWGWTDGEGDIVKSMGEISKGFNPSFFGYKQAALHTRQPTTGNRVKENSHPFKIGNLIGMHNGVVHNHDELQKKYERKCEVDSEHIFHHIDEGKDLSDIRAYGAIVFYKDGVLHLGRFNGGSLTLVRTSIGWLFASTREALDVALQFSGLRDGAIFYKLKEDRLYKIVGKDIVKDMKLNFGEYNKQTYGTWENNKWVPNNGGGRAASTFSGYSGGYGGGNNSNHFQTTTAAAGKYSDKDGEYTTENINGKWYKVRGAGQGRILTAIDYDPTQKSGGKASRKNGKKAGASTVNDRITQLLEAAAATRTQVTDYKADEYPCQYCNDVLKNGDLFGMIDNGEILCEYCSLAYAPDDIVGGILANVLPTEVMLVEAFFNEHDRPEDKYVTCDECDEKMGKGEWFACGDNEFLCLDCYMDKHKVKSVDDYDIEASSTAFPTEAKEEKVDEVVEKKEALDADGLALFNQQLTEQIQAAFGTDQEDELDNVVPFKNSMIM
jgi:hypothetical protein